MSNAIANINTKSLNLFLARFYTANHGRFTASGKFEDLGIAYEFEFAAAPYFELDGPGDQPNAVTLACDDFKVTLHELNDKQEKGEEQAGDTYKLSLTGTTAVRADMLYLNLVSGKVSGGGDQRILTRIINRVVIPNMNEIALPKFWEVVSKYIPIELENVLRADGAMHANLRLNNQGSQAGFGLPKIYADRAMIGASIGSTVIERYVQQLAGIPSHIHESDEIDIKIAGARISLDVAIGGPYLSMQDGQARISLSVAPRTNLNLWTLLSSLDIPFNVPTATAVGALNISNKGNEIWLDGTLESLSFEVRPNLPAPFNILEKAIGEAILNLLSGPVTAIISAALGRIHFKVFELPEHFPGSAPIPATVKLDDVVFQKDCLQLRVDLG